MPPGTLRRTHPLLPERCFPPGWPAPTPACPYAAFLPPTAPHTGSSSQPCPPTSEGPVLLGSRWALCPPPLQAATLPRPLQPVGQEAGGGSSHKGHLSFSLLGAAFLTVLHGTHAPSGLLPRWTPSLATTFCPLWPQGSVTEGPCQAWEAAPGEAPGPGSPGPEMMRAEEERTEAWGPARCRLLQANLALSLAPKRPDTIRHQPKSIRSAGPLISRATKKYYQ